MCNDQNRHILMATNLLVLLEKQKNTLLTRFQDTLLAYSYNAGVKQYTHRCLSEMSRLRQIFGSTSLELLHREQLHHKQEGIPVGCVPTMPSTK